MGADMKCYLACPSGFIANQTLHCQVCNNCDQGLYFSITTSIIRDTLYLYLIFTQPPLYLLPPNISLLPALPF